MANLIVALFAVMIILIAMAGFSTSSVNSQDKITLSVKAMRNKTGVISRTIITSLGTSVITDSRLDFTVKNSGQSQIREVTDWDVIVWYEGTASGLQIDWLTYTTSPTPSAGEWTLSGIYEDAGTLDPEVYQPGIVNPGEEFIIRAELGPAVATSSSNTVTVGVEHGVTVTAVFTN